MAHKSLRDPHGGRRVSPAVLWFVLILGAVGSTSPALAQAVSVCEEASAREFDFWIGDWEIRQRILRADGSYLSLPAKTSVTPALNGCALIERWEGQVQFFWEGMTQPESMQAISVRAYDPRRGAWSIHWMDTRSRRFDTPYVGSFAGDSGDFYREWETPAGHRVGRIRFTRPAPDSVHWSLAVSSDGRQTWSTIWSMEMRRTRR